MESEPQQQKVKLINLVSLIASKNPRLAKNIPSFVYRYLNRKLHIDEINHILKKYGHLPSIDFITALVEDFNLRISINGIENIPKKGRYIFASNHPLGGFDGLLLLSEVSKKLGSSLFLVRDELTKLPPLKDVFIPINKFGNQRESANIIKEAYESDSQILIFPAGMTSRRIKGKIVDLKWNNHFIKKSKQYKRDIIPVFIDGRNSGLFYNIANIRKLLKIKFNIEMLLLSDELFKQRGGEISITFGEPIPWTHFNKTHSSTYWASEIKNTVYNLNQHKKNKSTQTCQ